MTACEAQGGAWENPPFNFDNIFDAMRTLFICSTTEGCELARAPCSLAAGNCLLTRNAVQGSTS